MPKTNRYYLVDESALPSVFLKVVEAKRLLQQGKAKTVNDAVSAAGLSRSAFYRYKDYVHPFYEKSRDSVVTFYADVNDEPGVLSKILNIFTEAGANILTINQNIPINGLAHISVSIRTENLTMTADNLLRTLKAADGVVDVYILASQ